MGIISKEDYQKLVYGSKDASPPPPDPVVRNRRGRSPSVTWDIELDGENSPQLGGSDDLVDAAWSH